MAERKTPALRVLYPPLSPGRGGYPAATWLTLMRVYTRLERRLARTLQEFGLTPPHLEVLINLGSAEGITQQDLAERLLVTKGNVCAILDKVGESGWVERRPDPVDRRANRLYLTAEGRRLLAKVMPAHDATLSGLMAVLPEARQKDLFELLGLLDAELRRLEN
jgi:DNA-binding MarR family transcriptional regulator